jgi:tripeptide aminopeptidase
VIPTSTRAAGLLALSAALANAPEACGQRSPAPFAPTPVSASSPRIRQALEQVRASEPQAIDEQVALCEIAAPPFKEAARAAEVRRRFAAMGLQNVRIDSVGNVLAERPGDANVPAVVFSGHLDTVFPEGTDVHVRREGTLLRGPGIGDDCRGLAVVLAVARAMDAAHLRTRAPVIFVATVGEEGPGNLRGVRHLFGSELKGRVGAFVSVDGGGLSVTKDAVGSRRYRIAYRGTGGHSYGDFGIPNPVHALGRAIALVSDFQVPREPKVTFNVGVVGGGTSVNSIAGEAWMEVDMRSVDPAALDRVDAALRTAVQKALDDENARWSEGERLTVSVESMGVRPAGTQRADAPIVRAAVAAGGELGFRPVLGASSTDANIAISLGVPAVTIDGGGTSQGTHSLSESFDTRGSERGTQWALLFLLSLAGVR